MLIKFSCLAILASVVNQCIATIQHVSIQQGTTCLGTNGNPIVGKQLGSDEFCSVFSVTSSMSFTVIQHTLSRLCIGVASTNQNNAKFSVMLQTCNGGSLQRWTKNSDNQIQLDGTQNCLTISSQGVLFIDTCINLKADANRFAQFTAVNRPRTIQIQHKKFPYMCAGGDRVAQATVKINPICAMFGLDSIDRLQNVYSSMCLDAQNGTPSFSPCSSSITQKWVVSPTFKKIQSPTTKKCLDIDYLHNKLVLGSCDSPNMIFVPATVVGKRPSRMFSPYIDESLTNIDIGDTVKANTLRHITFGFVISGSQNNQPIWGSDSLVGQPSTSADQKMIDARSNGAQVIVSFGGAAGSELALVSSSTEQLQATYQSVIDYYGVSTLDFDIEGTTLDNIDINSRRFDAIKGLKRKNANLEIIYTLPVETMGLIQNGLDFVKLGISRGVKPDIINIMTMDYGSQQNNMGAAAISASQNTYQQMKDLGLDVFIGITPMIGVNDQSGTFTANDAGNVVAFAKQNSYIKLLSFWSLNRDNGLKRSLDYSSMIDQGVFDFSNQFATFQK
ncbi:hypothetical protein RTP6_005348 [Batrachochytrium dendrobatidis]